MPAFSTLAASSSFICSALEFALGSLLHGCADLLIGSGFLKFAGEVNEGDVAGRNTQGHAGEFAIELRENLTHGLCSTGGGRNDVLQDAAAAAPILLGRAVNGLLGSGCSVNGGHEAALYTEAVVQDLGKRSKAVGGAGSVGDDGLASVGLVVDTINEHGSCIL